MRHGIRILLDIVTDTGVDCDKVSWTWRQEELLLATSIFQVFSLWLIKAALISVYVEFVQKLLLPSQRLLLWATGIVTLVSFFAMLGLHGYWCPLVELERLSMDDLWAHRCVANSLTPHLITNVFNILTDVMLLLSGFSIVKALKFTAQQMRALSIIIFIAFLTISVACIRMGSQIYSYSDGHGGFVPYPPEDKLNPEILSDITTDLEVYVAGIAACLPGLRLFVRSQVGYSDKEKALVRTSTVESKGSGGSENSWNGAEKL